MRVADLDTGRPAIFRSHGNNGDAHYDPVHIAEQQSQCRWEYNPHKTLCATVLSPHTRCDMWFWLLSAST